MKTLYWECGMGAAGDMLMASLLELDRNPEEFIEMMNASGIPGVVVEQRTAVKCGLSGTTVSVYVHGEKESPPEAGHDHQGHKESPRGAEHYHDHGHDHECGEKPGPVHAHEEHHHHHDVGMEDIARIIQCLSVSERVKADALQVYQLIAAAEAHVHGRPVSEVHFHELGMLDAVADIVGVCLLVERLAPAQILASPVNVGGGTVKCAHGVYPVPAPATAYILQGVPIYGGLKSELCTPTGAALLKHLVDNFVEEMPGMVLEQIAYGMGSKDFSTPNCVRAFWGEVRDNKGVIAELSCNLDDMTAEQIGYAQNVLFAYGALDVFSTPIQMKKSRPATLLTCLCPLAKAEEMARLMLLHTTSFGVRMKHCPRFTLNVQYNTVTTRYGDIQIKMGSGYGLTRIKPEYEDVALRASQHEVPFSQVWKAAVDSCGGGDGGA